MEAGHQCSIVGPSVGGGGDQTIELEQLDSGGSEWYASGPAGEHLGGLAEVITAAAEAGTEPDWLDLVTSVLASDGHRRTGLIARRGNGVMFHTTFAENRASIRRHGLDWRRFDGTGIAGSRRPEADGIFLSSDLGDAEWFAEMGRGRDGGRDVDIWAVALNGQWLISDPSAGGGTGDNWMICLDRIPSRALTLRTSSPLG